MSMPSKILFVTNTHKKLLNALIVYQYIVHKNSLCKMQTKLLYNFLNEIEDVNKINEISVEELMQFIPAPDYPT